MKKELTRNEIYNKYQHADKWDINEVLRVLLQKKKNKRYMHLYNCWGQL